MYETDISIVVIAGEGFKGCCYRLLTHSRKYYSIYNKHVSSMMLLETLEIRDSINQGNAIQSKLIPKCWVMSFLKETFKDLLSFGWNNEYNA